MTTNVMMQLADGEGLMSVVMFQGLSHSMIMHPVLLGEPTLTRQALYYMAELDAAALISFDEGRGELSEEQIECLVDNYLFAYSKRHPESRVSFKVAQGKFSIEDSSDYYRHVDRGNTLALAIDSLNDPAVSFVEPVEKTDQVNLMDWNIGVNYVEKPFHAYRRAVGALLEKRVNTLIAPSHLRDGYIGRLRVLKPDNMLIDYQQAIELTEIRWRSILPDATQFQLAPSECRQVVDALPIERIEVSGLRSPILLSHYFSGLKERNPMKAFVGFYNVLEYYFEEAPLLLQRVATTERMQLQCLVELLVSEGDVANEVARLSPEESRMMCENMITSSGIEIQAFNPAAPSLRAELARWLYETRCAVVHSKKTRRGQPVAAFYPYSAHAKALRYVIPVLQWLTVACIEKDVSLNGSGPAP
ncbi:MAG: hypothetical protein NVV68_07200 [Dokdonella sp.]|nr:hypothetical protein [Dokdonella sp.]